MGWDCRRYFYFYLLLCYRLSRCRFCFMHSREYTLLQQLSMVADLCHVVFSFFRGEKTKRRLNEKTTIIVFSLFRGEKTTGRQNEKTTKFTRKDDKNKLLICAHLLSSFRLASFRGEKTIIWVFSPRQAKTRKGDYYRLFVFSLGGATER